MTTERWRIGYARGPHVSGLTAGLRTPIALGHSWGANVVLELGVKEPDLVSALILLDGGFMSMRGRMDWRSTKEMLAPPPIAGMHVDQWLSMMRGYMSQALEVTPEVEAVFRSLMRVDREGKIVHETPLTVDHPNAHRDTRLVRKLDNGHYLVCHEGDGVVREYDETGKVVWSYALDLNGREETPGHDGHGTNVFGAIRLRNGDTLIAGGNNNRVLEVTPAGKIVWSVDYNELPGIRLYWVTTLEMLPNGHLVIGNTHAGPDNPQLIEITRDKKVVWIFKNFESFGNDVAAAAVLDVKGKVIR